MNRFYTIMFMVLFGTLSATAQTVRFGFRGGANESHYSFDKFALDGNAVTPLRGAENGYQVGAVMRIQIPKFIHIQPELNYQVRNYTLLTSGDNFSGKRNEFKSTTIKLPVTMGFNIGALRLFGGPVFTLDSTVKNRDDAGEMDIEFDDSEVAFVVGGGFDIKNFFIDLRYTTFGGSTYSTISINDASYKAKVLTDELWELSVGFFF
ncbi:MAG: PorT family protein [Tidjanibacter sp.]|nr:PorT family protein [Tidjanibacter sp.]